MSRKPQETNAYKVHMNPIRREECWDPCQTFRCFWIFYPNKDPYSTSIVPKIKSWNDINTTYSWHDWLSCNAFLKKQWILDSKALQISINLTPQVILPSFVENTRCIDLVGVGPVSTEAFNAIGRNGRSYVRNIQKQELEDDDDSIHSDSSCNLNFRKRHHKPQKEMKTMSCPF